MPGDALVLVFERDAALRAKTCAWVEAAGYACVAIASPDAAAPYVRTRDDLALVVHGVSPPCTWGDITKDNIALGELPCALLIHGDRPEDELTELAWACRAAAHAGITPDGSTLIAVIRQLLPARPIEPKPPSLDEMRRSGVARRRRKLLLVDDSEFTLEMIQEALTEAGFDVRIAVAAMEALSIGATWQPDVAIVDLRRPEATEGSLCAALKANGVLLTIVASSVSEPALARAQRSSAADGYVSKSKGLKSYVRRVEQIVARALSAETAAEGS